MRNNIALLLLLLPTQIISASNYLVTVDLLEIFDEDRVIGNFSKGETVNVTQVHGEWALVESITSDSNKRGWANILHLKKNAEKKTALLSGTVKNSTKQYLAGNKTLRIPAPTGFHEVDKTTSPIWDFGKELLPKNATPITMFISKEDLKKEASVDDIPDYSHYMLLAYFNKSQNTHISQVQFNEAKRYIKKSHEKLIDSSQDTSKSITDKATNKFSKTYDVDVSMEIDQAISLGTHDETTKSIIATTLTKENIIIDGKREDYTMVACCSMILYSGKILYAYVYKEVKEPEHIQWAKDKVY